MKKIKRIIATALTATLCLSLAAPSAALAHHHHYPRHHHHGGCHNCYDKADIITAVLIGGVIGHVITNTHHKSKECPVCGGNHKRQDCPEKKQNN